MGVNTMTAQEIYEQVQKLTPEEQEKVRELLANPRENNRHGQSWLAACGAVKYPFFGEDAQEYVSRSRRESDEQRGL
jgi:hypothetical protein